MPPTIVDLERPIGKNAHNEREKMWKRQDNMSSNLAKVINNMKEDKKSQDMRTKK